MANELRKRQLLVGIDVGTTSIKGAVFDADGYVLSEYCQDYSRSRPHAGWVEQNPDDWMNAIVAALTQFQCHIPLADIACLAVCSQVNTHVFVDEDGLAVMPAIVWQDTRSKDIAAKLDASFSTSEKQRIWGSEFVLDSSFALSRAAWAAAEQPEHWHRTRWILSPKDYCNMKICGSLASDPLSSVGLVGADGQYLAGLEEALPGFTGKLPPLSDPFAVIGKTALQQFPDLHADVVNGTMDAWAGFFGSGMSKSGGAALMAGTSSIVGIMSDLAIPTKGVISFPPFDGRHVHAGPTQSGSDAFSWISKVVGKGIQQLLDECKDRVPADNAPLFLPHLDGERAPIWDPIARGCFIGLTGSHDHIDMALAVIEGVAFSERQLFEECVRAAGLRPEVVSLSGGASANEFWSQKRADVLGVALERTKVRNAGVIGAGIIASVGAGLFPDWKTAIDKLVSYGVRFNPSAKSKETIDRRYALYCAAYMATSPLFEALNDLSNDK